MNGTLYLCATPIGNLADISQRFVETMELADLVAAEDTRVSIKLLNHLNIKKTLVSYHEHNKAERGAFLISQLKEGKNVTAEEWITDEEALNKKKTGLNRMSAKFRIKTIDRKDNIFETISNALR